jgi:16S rRNA (cytosine967-C5)-methyltransferase
VRCANRRRHVKAFVNAVLRNFQRGRTALLKEADSTDAGHYSYPHGGSSGCGGLPVRSTKYSGNRQRASADDAEVNRRRSTPHEYLQELERAGLGARMLEGGALTLLRPVPVEQLPRFGQGVVSVQDAGRSLPRGCSILATACACWMPALRPVARPRTCLSSSTWT